MIMVMIMQYGHMFVTMPHYFNAVARVWRMAIARQNRMGRNVEELRNKG
jgi:hypothetical protein